MIRNYFRIALRNFSKNKSYITINALGLGISLACCITAYLLLAFNMEFDNFHADEKVSHVFRLHMLSKDADGKSQRDFQSPMILPPLAAQDITGIERFTRYLFGNGSLRYNENTFNEDLAFADSSFFELFEYPLKSGNHKFFKDKNTIFLSEELAEKYFGNEDPIGKLMVLNAANDSEVELLVGGVLRKIPFNNTFRFPALLRIENFMDINQITNNDWRDGHNPSTFIELTDPKNAGEISTQLSKYIPTRNRAYTDIVVDAYSLEPFKSSFNESDFRQSWVNHRMKPQAIFIFAAMVLIILLIACFNLTNTSIAMTAKRLKEVGIRKAIGAARRQIITQFLFETLLIISLSLAVGLLMAQFIVPAFSNMWNLPYGIEDMDGVNLFTALIILVFLTALLAGIYPALLGSSFKPALLLKGSVSIRDTKALTRTLVGMQFALSVIVLIAGVVFIQNTKFQGNIKFGYDKEQIITVKLKGGREFEAMEKTILSNHKILSVAVSHDNVGGSNYQTPVTVDTTKHNVQAMGVGKNYFETIGMRLTQGRIFNPDNASDQYEGVIVNTTFVEKTGLKDPLDKIVMLHNRKRRILGVIEDHVDNLWRSTDPEPFVFYPAASNDYETMLVKTEHADLSEIQKYLEATWKQLYPARPFESQFLEDVVLKESRDWNANLNKTFLFITVLGGILSASGIFALASLNIARRTKEIGIRKTLGASISNVVSLLNKEFVIILSVAGILGAIAGFYFTSTILEAIYAHHTPVGIASVIACALLIFSVGIFTTSTTIFKAARANPIDSLRNE